VENIQSSSQRLLALVGQILELGRLRAGRLQLDLWPTDLRRAIGRALDEVRPLAEHDQLRLDAAMPVDLPPVSADAERVQPPTCSRTRHASRRRVDAFP
jgi:signal transduction histidine kinase